MSATLTESHRRMLVTLQTATLDLAKKLQHAHEQGFQVNFNINGQAGTVDKFEVTRAVPVDFTAGTN